MGEEPEERPSVEEPEEPGWSMVESQALGGAPWYVGSGVGSSRALVLVGLAFGTLGMLFQFQYATRAWGIACLVIAGLMFIAGGYIGFKAVKRAQPTDDRPINWYR